MILIAYGSKYGGTRICVEALSKRFADQEVQIKNIEQDDIDLKDFDKVIVGGPIFASKLYQPVTDFLEQNKTLLLEKKLSLFICGSGASEFDEEQIQKAYDAQLLDHALTKVRLGYIIDPSKYNFITKMLMKMITKSGDYRKEIYAEAIEQLYRSMLTN